MGEPLYKEFICEVAIIFEFPHMGKPLYKDSLCEVATIQGMDLWGRSHSIKNLYVGR